MWQSLALYGFLSINLGVLMLGGYYLGGLLEKYYHLKNASYSGVFIGLLLGLYEMFTKAFKAGSKK